MHALQRLPPRDEGREQQVAERAILEQQRSQSLAVDRDIPELTRDHRRRVAACNLFKHMLECLGMDSG
jgi:hypothetical protein